MIFIENLEILFSMLIVYNKISKFKLQFIYILNVIISFITAYYLQGLGIYQNLINYFLHHIIILQIIFILLFIIIPVLIFHKHFILNKGIKLHILNLKRIEKEIDNIDFKKEKIASLSNILIYIYLNKLFLMFLALFFYILSINELGVKILNNFIIIFLTNFILLLIIIGIIFFIQLINKFFYKNKIF